MGSEMCIRDRDRHQTSILLLEGDGAERGRQDDEVDPGLTCRGGARREAGHSPAPGHACHGAPVAGNFQHRWTHSMGGVGGVLTPLENRASLSNVATQEGAVSSQGFSFLRPFVAVLGEPENLAQAR